MSARLWRGAHRARTPRTTDFDPVAAGQRYGLSPTHARALWDAARAEVAARHSDDDGAHDPLARAHFERLAARATGAGDARRIAERIREGGAEGLPGLRAIGLELAARGGVAQVSMNVEDHRALPLAEVVAAIARHAPVGEAELVGLAPAAAFAGFPADVPVRGRRTVEDVLDRRLA